MSDATPTSTKKSGKGWSEAEKLGLLFQIIEKAGTIPWATIDLPEGRTVKACSVMVDKEKAKVRKAKEAAVSGEGGDDDGMTPTATPKSKKRAATEEATPSASAKKTTRTPRKSKKALQAEADAAEAAEAGEEEDEMVKAKIFE